MKHTCVLLLITANVVLSYHFYNPLTHDLLERTSLDDAPKGYRLLAPPKDHKRKTRLSRGKNDGHCTDGGFTCDAPYSKSLTFQFECTSDDQCPTYYKCCPQKCFLHKVCIKASPSTHPNGNGNCKERQGQCAKWPYNCATPYHYSMTSIFKCDKDSQCPKNFKCCQQNCFLHKICSRIATHTQTTQPIKLVTGSGRILGVHEDVTTTTEEADTEESTTEEEITTESTSESTTESTTLSTEETEATTEILEEGNNGEDYDETEKQTELSQPPLEVNLGVQVTQKEEETTTETEEDATTIVETTKSGGLVPSVRKNIPARSTPDSNAIDPNYADYYYHYDNENTTDEYDDEDNYDEDEEIE